MYQYENMAVNMEKNNKTNGDRQLICFRDAVITALLIASAFAVYALRSGASANAGSIAEVSFDGKVIGTISLYADGEYSYPQLEGMTFTVSAGTICVSESDCADRICVRSGKLSHAGEAAVCVPNRAAVTVISSGTENDIDAVVR